MLELYYDILTGHQVDSAGSRRITAPRIAYEEVPLWRIRFVHADSAAGTVTPVDVRDALAWRAAIDDDFDSETDPMCRTLDENIDATQAEDGIIDVLLDAFTPRFLAVVDGKAKVRDCPFELAGYNYEGQKAWSAIILTEATGAVDPAGGDPPDPPGDYYNKTEIDAKLRAGYELQYSVDGATLWHDEQVALDRYWRYRYPAGEWSDGIAMVVGPQGEQGEQGEQGTAGDMTNPMTTAGDTIIGGVDGAPARLGKGTQYQVKRQGATNPEWADAGYLPGTALADTADMAVAHFVTGVLKVSKGSALTLTIKAHADVAYPVDRALLILNLGVGVLTVQAAAGVDLNGEDGGSFDLSQFDGATIIRVGEDDWAAINQDVEAAP